MSRTPQKFKERSIFLPWLSELQSSTSKRPDPYGSMEANDGPDLPAKNPLVKVDASVRDSIIEKALASLGTPRALAVHLLYRAGDHDQILALSHPESFDPVKFKKDYQATKLLSKADFLQLGIDRRAVAMGSFWKSEAQCHNTNHRIRSSEDDAQHHPALNSLLYAAARKISRIIGPFPGAQYFNEDGVGFGPGATSSCKGRDVSSQYKYQARLDTTPAAAGHVLDTVRYHDLWLLAASGSTDSSVFPVGFKPTEVRGNKLHVVPKNAKTDRVICVEPHGNIWLQKTVGSYLRRKLQAVGIDLDDQTRNQRAARKGSRDGSVATIDLSSASDTVSYELVRALLPAEWFDYLNDLRSPFTNVDGRWVRLEKFSSMGNGYTFELESLIFYSIVSLFDDEALVYGDDIIVKTAVAATVVKALELCGFSCNKGKTYLEGDFRESCGGDYYLGVEVSPVYIKSLDDGADVINVHNRIRSRFNIEDQPGLLPSIRKLFPGFLGCSGYGEGHYHVNFDELCPPRLRGGWEGFIFKTFLAYPIRSRDTVGPFAKLSAALGPNAVRQVDGSRIQRGRYRFRVGRAIASDWQDVLFV